MTIPLSKYNRVIAAPDEADLAAAWTVLEGMVIIRGEQTLRIPAGGTWPGESALPQDVARHIGVIDATAVQGTVVTPHVTPAAIEAGQALVLAQALTLGNAEDRLPLMLTRYELNGIAHGVAASIVNLSRQHFLRLRGPRYARPKHQPAPKTPAEMAAALEEIERMDLADTPLIPGHPHTPQYASN